jgi:hypothetical protein
MSPSLLMIFTVSPTMFYFIMNRDGPNNERACAPLFFSFFFTESIYKAVWLQYFYASVADFENKAGNITTPTTYTRSNLSCAK